MAVRFSSADRLTPPRFPIFLALTLLIWVNTFAQVTIAKTLDKPDLPNVVWIVSDDLGPELGCYGYQGVATPNINRLAAGGTRYSLAFSTSPVCSSSRTAFITGQYQTTVGGHHHVTRDLPKLTEKAPTVVGLMRKAGYFVCNGNGQLKAGKKLAKTHFNFVYDKHTFFDGNDWSQRAKGQPFFAQIQIKEPHRTLHKSKKDRPNAIVPPYYPQHPITFADWSNYLASIEVLDKKVGMVLDRLEDEGLADNTLVLFFGDHGRPHVRGKQWLYDGGLHTPLIARWPEKVRTGGEVDSRLVSLLDLMPTTLAAGGVPIPKGVRLHGQNLFDSTAKQRECLFAARDRCGDAFDRIRSIRTRSYKYIRNYHPELPYLQLSSYKKLQYPVATLMAVLKEQGRWDSPFLASTRPPEELYDLKADPHEMVNLANVPVHQQRLAGFREQLDQWIKDTGDLGGVDESKSVDMQKLMKEKRKYYEKGMKGRRLDPEISDSAYLHWWEKELGVRD